LTRAAFPQKRLCRRDDYVPCLATAVVSRSVSKALMRAEVVMFESYSCRCADSVRSKTYKQKLGPGEDPRVIAARLAKEVWQARGGDKRKFSGPIHHPLSQIRNRLIGGAAIGCCRGYDGDPWAMIEVAHVTSPTRILTARVPRRD
jgi:hypothetical protein